MLLYPYAPSRHSWKKQCLVGSSNKEEESQTRENNDRPITHCETSN